jgi:glycosyltransferase involved in cell wall biosynthesis
MPNEYKNEIECLGGRTYYIPMLTMYNFASFYQYIKTFFQAHGGQYKTLHLHEVLIGFILLPLAKHAGITTRIIHSHNSVASEKKINAIRNSFLCLPLKRQATHYFACSRKAGVFLYGEKWMHRVTVINNGVDCIKYSYSPIIREPVRKELGLENNLVIGHIGRFCIQKNQFFLIYLLSEIRKRIPNICLLFIGDGPMRIEIENTVQQMGLTENVQFLGTRSDIDRILQAIDIFILPSLFEGLPIVGVEAQAAGLPCIVSDTITEELKIIDNMFFVNLSDNLNVWIDKIIDVSNSCYSRDTSLCIKEAGFDIRDQVRLLESFYIQN